MRLLMASGALWLALAGCSTLRQGWVRVDFLDGHPSPEVVCQLRQNLDGDLEAKCVDLQTVAEAIVRSRRVPTGGDL